MIESSNWPFAIPEKVKSKFSELRDESLKMEVIELTGAPADARDFLFWRNEGDLRWGLTMKPKPKFGESPLWMKVSLTGKIGGNSLRPSKDSQHMIKGLEGDSFLRILEIYKNII